MALCSTFASAQRTSTLWEVALVVYDVRDLVKVYPKRAKLANDDPLLVPTTVGYIPQESHSLNTLTVGEALYFTAHLRGTSRPQARRERDALLELWQMGDIRDRDNSRLSGGQRRLLRLAVAMAGSLPVLILDEPTNDLDPLRRRLVWDVLQRVNREQGTTIVFITHDAIEAEKVIERVDNRSILSRGPNPGLATEVGTKPVPAEFALAPARSEANQSAFGQLFSEPGCHVQQGTL